jgi:hypothetical protein
MRRIIPDLAAVIWVGWSATPGYSQSDARQIVEAAVSAHGGADVLAKYPAAKVKVKGQYSVKGQDIDYSGESVYQLPDRLRSEVQLRVQGRPRTVVQILNGDRSAMVVGEFAQEIPEAQLQELRLSAYCQNLARLNPLLKDRRFNLTSVGQKPIDGKPAQGVRVSAAGQKDVVLYFDAASHLLVMLDRPGFDANGAKVQQQEYYTDYRSANGLKYAVKNRVVQNGKPVLQSEVIDFTPLERVDSKEFAIPQ